MFFLSAIVALDLMSDGPAFAENCSAWSAFDLRQNGTPPFMLVTADPTADELAALEADSRVTVLNSLDPLHALFPDIEFQTVEQLTGEIVRRQLNG